MIKKIWHEEYAKDLKNEGENVEGERALIKL